MVITRPGSHVVLCSHRSLYTGYHAKFQQRLAQIWNEEGLGITVKGLGVEGQWCTIAGHQVYAEME
jgi:predicted GIY-YIG superfamily endonuclease